MMESTALGESLTGTAGFLQGRANRYAWLGLLLAVVALILANLLSCYVEHRVVSLEKLIAVQKSNPALWLLDVMPLLFMAWGQYIGIVMSYQAGAMVLDETRALREHTSILEHQLTQQKAALAVPASETGLPGREAFMAEVTKVLARRQLRAGKCAVLVLDTDQYQGVAQSLGEEAARELIAQFAGRMRNILGEDDFLAHFGMDDFAVLMPRLSEDTESRQLASRIQLALDTPLTIQRQPMSLRLAVGIAHFPAHGDNAEQLLRRADMAKYAAAANGREYAVYDAAMENARAEGPRLIAELHAALNHDGLAEEYELQRPLRDGLAPRLRLAPYWPHPRSGRLEEAAFLNLPNRASLTHSLTLWMIRESLARLAQWRKARAGLGLVVRLPDAAYSQLAVADMIFRLLASHGLPPSALTLEISQRALLSGGGAALAQIQQLRAQQVGLALTDVGAPGSSPSSRLYYPFDEIRTTPDLLHRALLETDCRLVLKSFCDLARALKLRIVLAGVGDEEARKLGESMNADYMEGAAVARRMSPADIGGGKRPAGS